MYRGRSGLSRARANTAAVPDSLPMSDLQASAAVLSRPNISKTSPMQQMRPADLLQKHWKMGSDAEKGGVSVHVVGEG